MKLLKIIKLIIKEEMISIIDDWERTLSYHDNVLSTAICEDNETGDSLYLFVGFTLYNNIHSFSYSFMVFDKEQTNKTGFLNKRDEVSPYIPTTLKAIPHQIFSIIKQMTRKLLDMNLPDKIIRETVEPLSGDSLIRYQEITDIMVNEYGYELISETKDDFGITKWVLKQKDKNNLNNDMNEIYELIHKYSLSELQYKAWSPFFKDLKRPNQN